MILERFEDGISGFATDILSFKMLLAIFILLTPAMASASSFTVSNSSGWNKGNFSNTSERFGNLELGFKSDDSAEQWRFDGHTATVYGVSAGPNGSFVYSGGSDDVVRK
ncbi:MAG: WD40 repeat domain-containing protein, partial [Candidatus Nanohaloarchaea archaeon]|nr:WD40 repeat domain-containing protein [Candidatus Nanohaloarchaea archaeon]